MCTTSSGGSTRCFDGRPFDRDVRSLIYERSKGTVAELAFGTERDIDQLGYEYLVRSARPVAQAMRMMASMNVSDPSMLNPHMLRKRVSPTEQRSYAELYEWLEPLELLNHAPPSWRDDWGVADPDTYAPAGARLGAKSPVGRQCQRA